MLQQSPTSSLSSLRSKLDAVKDLIQSKKGQSNSLDNDNGRGFFGEFFRGNVIGAVAGLFDAVQNTGSKPQAQANLAQVNNVQVTREVKSVVSELLESGTSPESDVMQVVSIPEEPESLKSKQNQR